MTRPRHVPPSLPGAGGVFACVACGLPVPYGVPGSRHRDHCPACLWSLHVDIVPGDRRAACRGSMEPIAVWSRPGGEWALVHRCTRCGGLRATRVAGDDDEAVLVDLARRPLARVPFGGGGRPSAGLDPRLAALGWTPALAAALAADGRAARVTSVCRGRCVVDHGGGPVDAVLAGAVRRAGVFPAVGDWVELSAAGPPAVVRAVLPRRGVLSRKEADRGAGERIIAVHVDTAFLVVPLDPDRDLRPRLVERLVALAWNGGIQPVVVLSKADLCADPAAQGLLAELAAPGVPVVPVSAVGNGDCAALTPWLVPGTTVAMLGHSGVGKSSLANRLLGAERRATGAVRAADGRGRHVTSAGELLVLPGGALLVDSPGVRELVAALDDGGIDATFPEIADLAGACRFGDCRHAGEPGCAVQAALAAGQVDPGRYAQYLELRREAAWQASRTDERARRERRLAERDIALLQRRFDGVP